MSDKKKPVEEVKEEKISEPKSKEVLDVEVNLPVKTKKPRSEKQKAASLKALAVLRERREAKEREEKAVKESREIEKDLKKNVKRVVPRDEIVTKKDLDNFMTSIKSMIGEKPIAVDKPVKPVVVERVVEKVKETPPPTIKLSGHALLDELFFKGR